MRAHNTRITQVYNSMTDVIVSVIEPSRIPFILGLWELYHIKIEKYKIFIIFLSVSVIQLPC